MLNSESQVTMGIKIKRFLESRAESKEVDLLKAKPNKKDGSESGGINTRLADLIKRNKGKLKEDQLEEYEKVKKAKKSKDQSDFAFQREKLDKLKVLANQVDLEAALQITEEYENAKLIIKDKHKPEKWLSDNCKNASGVSFATHVAKLTHSSIQGASNLYDYSESTSLKYLTTGSLSSKKIDIGVDNNAYTPISELLKLVDTEKSLFDYIDDGDIAPFMELTDDSELAGRWVFALKEALDGSRKSSHILAKQVYWLCDDVTQYHLLLPINSSSLSHSIYEHMTSDKNKESKTRRKERKYSEYLAIYYPNRAILGIPRTGIKNSLTLGNVSPLNKDRRGIQFLLPISPPVWRSNLQPPINQRSLFGYAVEKRTSNTVDRLRKILIAMKLKKTSIKEPKNHDAIVSLIEDISDDVLDYVACIQALTDLSGWSKESKLRKSHQHLLDIYRNDEDFQEQRTAESWKKEVAQDFGDWLNARLRYKTNLQLGPIQAALWRDLFQKKMRTFLAEMEANQ